MIVKNPQFEVSAVSPKQYPKNGLPEIVLVGKSNVGKSSFVNTMINRKKLARTSSEPGKTRQINFYNIDDSFYFVDLPGYGYSKMSKKEQAQVGDFIEEYLFNRKEIALIIFLIDIRHNPTANDLLMYNYVISAKLPSFCSSKTNRTYLYGLFTVTVESKISSFPNSSIVIKVLPEENSLSSDTSILEPNSPFLKEEMRVNFGYLRTNRIST